MPIIKNALRAITPPFIANGMRAFGELYEAVRPSGYYSSTPDLNFTHEEMIELADLDVIRSLGREVYSNFAPVAGAIHEKAQTSVGQHWVPIYQGEDEEWGKAATDWLREFYKVMDVRGAPFDWINNLNISSISLDRDGEYFIMPIRDQKTGWPSFQYFESHRIGSRTVHDDETRFPQWRFKNGVWRNSAGRPMAYRVLGEDDRPEDDRIVGARNLWHFYDPRWFSQGRGMPTVLQGILDWKDTKKFRENTKTAANVFSSLTVIEKNSEGKADTTRDHFRSQSTGVTNDVTNQEKKIHIEEYMRGAIRYIRANGKNELQAFKYDTPPHQVVNFIHSIMRGAFSGMDWPIEQAYDMSGLGTAQVRAITNKCQRAINRRQYLLNQSATRTTNFAIAAAATAGFIPPPPLDWWRWGFAMPPKMTADAYREAAQDREDYKIGFLNLREAYGKRGEWWVDHIDQKFREEAHLNKRADETGIKLEHIRMLTPNGNPLNGEENQDDEDDSQDQRDSNTNNNKSNA